MLPWCSEKVPPRRLTSGGAAFRQTCAVWSRMSRFSAAETSRVCPVPGPRVGFPAEDSPRGLWRSLGKRVGFTPSRVRISYPPPQAISLEPPAFTPGVRSFPEKYPPHPGSSALPPSRSAGLPTNRQPTRRKRQPYGHPLAFPHKRQPYGHPPALQRKHSTTRQASPTLHPGPPAFPQTTSPPDANASLMVIR